MKRFIAFVLVLMLSIGFEAVLAEGDLEVQVIGGAETSQPLSLDDIEIGALYQIDGYATVSPTSFGFVDCFAQYDSGKAGDNSGNGYAGEAGRVQGINGGTFKYMEFQNSGESADFAFLKVDITNLGKKPVAFMQEAKVTVFYNEDEYEFAGWARQFNYDYNTYTQNNDGVETGPAALDPADEFEIATMYTGHFVFGYTLPTAVVNSTESLKMVIELGDNELTYNIRK